MESCSSEIVFFFFKSCNVLWRFSSWFVNSKSYLLLECLLIWVFSIVVRLRNPISIPAPNLLRYSSFCHKVPRQDCDKIRRISPTVEVSSGVSKIGACLKVWIASTPPDSCLKSLRAPIHRGYITFRALNRTIRFHGLLTKLYGVPGDFLRYQHFDISI